MLRQIVKQINKSLDVALPFARSICTTRELWVQEDTKEKIPEKPTILLEKDNNITLIGLNRPEQRNAIDAVAAAKLCEAFNAFEADETSPVAVLYGVGGSFCSGFDILDLATEDREDISMEMLMTQEGSVGPTRRFISKPVVCGISGYCVAGGMELALMCDLRVMEETAILGFFNRRFGVPVIDGGTVRLPAMIGFSRALDLILTGRQVNADEAYKMGIANRIVPTGTSLGKAMELATTLSRFPQGALRHDRNSLYSAVFGAINFNQAVQNEIMYTSKDIIDQMQEGIKWFNRTFKSDTTYSWMKREMSMADWDDERVAAEASKLEQSKQAEKARQIEAEKTKKEEQKKPKEE
ncbi:probable enoyl-CoA hydratase echA8 [Teleopsis dalmanni]|uniref:probable enoyl-CoA hydratase echA8 n=1 Tax=Teleopsis dalmanni TaxID=139649 RepID=UPI000D32A9C6|nr:probable enoyl-CoA hydratase echA8 [Teleopsis dalmanni]